MRNPQRLAAGIVAAGIGCAGLVAWHLQSDPEPAADPTCRPTCEAMPIRDLPGWSQVFADDFLTDVPVGEFPGTVYGDTWRSHQDARPDTSGNGLPMPSKVLSVRDGALDMFIRTEDPNHLVSAPIPKVPTGGYGKYSVRFRTDPLPGYKTAWLLAPDTNEIPEDSEISWPEGNLDWHVATTTWEPGKVTFELDGQVISVAMKQVSDKPMHWVLRTETSTDEGDVPDDLTQGHVQIDWAVAYRPDTGAPPPPSSPTRGEAIVLAAVGDINEDNHSETTTRSGLLASSIKKAEVDALAVLGDFQYEYGDCGSLVDEYDRTGMGELLPKTIGTAGATHDWTSFSDQDNYRRHMAGTCPRQTTGESLSAARWGRDVGPQTSHWVDLGTWRVFSVSSGLWRYNTDAAEEVTTWLDTELARGKAAGDNLAVIWHEPYWTSNSVGHDRTTDVQPWVEVLDEHGVRIVLSGHQHGYERFHPQNADGTRNDASGTQQFIVGTGGIGSYVWEKTLRNSAAVQSDTWGWLKLTLQPDGHYDWRFVRTGGAAFSDAGSR